MIKSMNSCLMFCCCILILDNLNTIKWFEWILGLRGLYKLAQIELVIEGARICTRDGYVPAIIRTRDGYVPARIRTRDGYVHVTSLQLTHDGYVHGTALRRTCSILACLLAYDRPAIGVRSACYWRTIGFWRTVLIIVYSHVNYIIDTKMVGAVVIQ